jgi:hypothetical protein
VAGVGAEDAEGAAAGGADGAAGAGELWGVNSTGVYPSGGGVCAAVGEADTASAARAATATAPSGSDVLLEGGICLTYP